MFRLVFNCSLGWFSCIQRINKDFQRLVIFVYVCEQMSLYAQFRFIEVIYFFKGLKYICTGGLNRKSFKAYTYFYVTIQL